MAHINGDKYTGKSTGESSLFDGGSLHESSPRDSHLEHGDDHHKKSVMSKVKDTAKKWKHNLVKMKHKSHHHHRHDALPTQPARLEEQVEENSEYHGAPIYESEKAADAYTDLRNGTERRKHASHDQQKTEALYARPEGLGKEEEEKAEYHGAPKYESQKAPDDYPGEKHQEVTDMQVDHNIQNGHGQNEMNMKEVQYDKGVSVKEYVIQTLQPGEGDKALSEVITDAVGTNKGFNSEMTMAEKVKEVVTSFLGVHEASNPVSANANHDEFQGKRLQEN